MVSIQNNKGDFMATADKDYDFIESGGIPASHTFFSGGGGFDDDLQLDRQLRLGFIRKVYSILSFQLLLTFAVSGVCVLNEGVRDFVLSHLWVVWVGFVLSIILLVTLLCYRRQHPQNIILLATWTFVEAYTVGVVCAAYASQGQGAIVVQAAGLTMAVFLSLTLFTFQTKIDFSFLGGALFASLWILIIWGFVMAIFGFQQSYLYSLFGAIIFSLYILYDTSQLMYNLGYDEYIVASINLYLDIINLFLYILRILASGDE